MVSVLELPLLFVVLNEISLQVKNIWVLGQCLKAFHKHAFPIYSTQILQFAVRLFYNFQNLTLNLTLNSFFLSFSSFKQNRTAHTLTSLEFSTLKPPWNREVIIINNALL